MHAIQKLLNRLLEIFTESVKVYTHCVFDYQTIEITYKHYSTLNTWATLMKQKLNYSQYVEQEQDLFRYVKNSELTREIRCHSDRIFPNLHQCYQWYSAPPPPSELCFVSSHFASVWEFSKMLLFNFGMFAISDCPFITCQNLQFLASMFVCRFVRLSVCLSVSFVKHNSWTLWHIITKLGPHMEWVSSSSMWHWQISRSWN